MKFLILLFLSLFLIAAERTALQEFTTANNLFARSVYKELSKTKNSNFLVSPFSAEILLALVQSGAKGESAEKLREILHLPNDKNKVESVIKSLLPKFRDNGLYTIHTANKIYFMKDVVINDEFKDAARTVYHTDIEHSDFTTNVNAVNKMNFWVKKQISNKIKYVIDYNDVDENTRMVLINALYFKANWSNPFHLSCTKKGNFFKTPAQTIRVDFLNHYKEHFNYYECPDLGAQFLELPFKGDEASMVLVVPNEKNGLQKLENNLEQVFESQHKLTPEYLNVAIPKFRVDTLIDFKSVLENLGVKKVFSVSQADFSGIVSDTKGLCISNVVQKTFVDVSEEGVGAAAATSDRTALPISARLEQPKIFLADHPFIFYIKVNNLITFVGRVTNPSKPFLRIC